MASSTVASAPTSAVGQHAPAVAPAQTHTTPRASETRERATPSPRAPDRGRLASTQTSTAVFLACTDPTPETERPVRGEQTDVSHCTLWSGTPETYNVSRLLGRLLASLECMQDPERPTQGVQPLDPSDKMGSRSTSCELSCNELELGERSEPTPSLDQSHSDVPTSSPGKRSCSEERDDSSSKRRLLSPRLLSPLSDIVRLLKSVFLTLFAISDSRFC